MLKHKTLECPTQRETESYEVNITQTELNLDCINLILNELSFPELLMMNDVSRHFSILAGYAFKQNYADREIVISNTRDLLFGWDEPEFIRKLRKNDLDPSECSVELNRIQIESTYLSLKTLKYFGGIVQKLYLLLTNVDTKHSKIIGQYVNQYCTDTLMELSIDVQKGNFLRFIKKPFKNVHRVNFNFWPGSSEFANNTLPLNETFPSLRTLFLNHPRTDFNSEYFRCNFPHLEHLSLTYGYKYMNVDLIKNLLNLNPQIRSLELEFCPEYLLQQISMILPQLERLSISMGLSVQREIRLDNVTKLKMNAIGNSLNIYFQKLQEMHMFFTSEKYSELITFLEQHAHLRRLNIQFWNIRPIEFEGITSNLPNLVEMTMNNYYVLTQIDFIIKYLNNNQTIMNFHLNNTNKNQKEEFDSQLNRNWNVYENGTGISFKRLCSFEKLEIF